MTKVLMVQWRDAESGRPGWTEKDDALVWAKDPMTSICISSGILVMETGEFITLAGSIIHGSYGELQKIPKGMILKREVVGTWPKKK